MKHLKALPALTALITLLLSSTLYAADKDSHLQQVETLFRLTQMEQKVDQSIDSVMQLQLSQNPQLSQHADQMRAFFEKYIGWDALFLIDQKRHKKRAIRYRPLFNRLELQPTEIKIYREGRLAHELNVYKYFGFKGKYENYGDRN